MVHAAPGLMSPSPLIHTERASIIACGVGCWGSRGYPESVSATQRMLLLSALSASSVAAYHWCKQGVEHALGQIAHRNLCLSLPRSQHQCHDCSGEL